MWYQKNVHFPNWRIFAIAKLQHFSRTVSSSGSPLSPAPNSATSRNPMSWMMRAAPPSSPASVEGLEVGEIIQGDSKVAETCSVELTLKHRAGRHVWEKKFWIWFECSAWAVGTLPQIQLDDQLLAAVHPQDREGPPIRDWRAVVGGVLGRRREGVVQELGSFVGEFRLEFRNCYTVQFFTWFLSGSESQNCLKQLCTSK